MKRMHSSSAGFTLIELLMTLGIVSLIFLSIYPSYIYQKRTAQIQEYVTDMQQALRLASNRIVYDLNNANAGIFSRCGVLLNTQEIVGIAEDGFCGSSARTSPSLFRSWGVLAVNTDTNNRLLTMSVDLNNTTILSENASCPAGGTCTINYTKNVVYNINTIVVVSNYTNSAICRIVNASAAGAPKPFIDCRRIDGQATKFNFVEGLAYIAPLIVRGFVFDRTNHTLNYMTVTPTPGAASVFTTTSYPIIHGVEEFQVEAGYFGITADVTNNHTVDRFTGGTAYNMCSSPLFSDATGNYDNVLAVRVSILARTTVQERQGDAMSNDMGPASAVNNADFKIGLVTLTPTPTADQMGHRYRLFQTIVDLKNTYGMYNRCE